MATRRGKTQARRNHGNSGGLPGWAWGVIGLLLGVALILGAPRLLRSDGDGFFRPRPNPDAEPAPVAIDDVVAADDDDVANDGAPARMSRPADKGGDKGGDKSADKGADYDFYTLLPGKEVALSDAELAATERAETQRAAQPPAATTAATTATKAGALPPPVGTAADVVTPPAPLPAVAPPTVAKKPTAATAATTSTAATSDSGARFLLQAGAFQASGQAEELKARIALLGLGARVESASINGKTVYRVRMGPYGSAGELAEAKRKLASGGLPGMAIKVQ